jgi:hypothetical protein
MSGFNIITIDELPAATAAISNADFIPISQNNGTVGTFKITMAMLKTWILGFVTPLIASIPRGPAGVAGTPGTQGIQGQQGVQGLQGATGQQGIQGETGAQGTIGIQGPTGQQGIKGDTGQQGVQGIQGEQGEQGLQGVAGADGGAFDMVAFINDSPTLDTEAAAVTAGLAPYTLYKTSTGELRYKLPAVTPPTPGGFPYTLPITL